MIVVLDLGRTISSISLCRGHRIEWHLHCLDYVWRYPLTLGLKSGPSYCCIRGASKEQIGIESCLALREQGDLSPGAGLEELVDHMRPSVFSADFSCSIEQWYKIN